MRRKRRQTEREHGGTKEGQTEEPEQLRGRPLHVEIREAQREEASILHYPPASRPSWRIFHLVPAVTTENWPRRCVLYSFAILLPYFLLRSSSNIHKQQVHICTSFRAEVRMTLISQEGNSILKLRVQLRVGGGSVQQVCVQSESELSGNHSEQIAF